MGVCYSTSRTWGLAAITWICMNAAKRKSRQYNGRIDSAMQKARSCRHSVILGIGCTQLLTNSRDGVNPNLISLSSISLSLSLSLFRMITDRAGRLKSCVDLPIIPAVSCQRCRRREDHISGLKHSAMSGELVWARRVQYDTIAVMVIATLVVPATKVVMVHVLRIVVTGKLQPAVSPPRRRSRSWLWPPT
jgi:hypothetical protein